MNFKPLALACATLVAVASAPAHAAFTGAYDASHWVTSGTGNGTAVIAAGGPTLALTGADYDAGNSPGATTLDYSITLAAPTTISFAWAYTSDDTSSTSDPFGIAVNGVSTQLSVDSQPGFIEQDGTYSLTLAKGDTFSFQASSTDSIFGASSTTISGFNAVTAVPEPASVALLLAGLVALAGVGRRRRRG